MIPKKIHYCWFGRGEKPKLAQKCIKSWKKYCSGYEIIEWNEDNFDINLNPYTKMCYEQKKYAFLSDYIRLVVVYRHGGIYLDTDVEIIKPFDDLLDCEAFFGFENEQYVNTGEGFGAEAENMLVKKMEEEYEPYLSGDKGTAGCPILNTAALCREGLLQDGNLQQIKGAVSYPKDFFNPLESTTGKLVKTDNTYSIHWYSMSWLPFQQRIKSKITKVFHRWFGTDCFSLFKSDN